MHVVRHRENNRGGFVALLNRIHSQITLSLNQCAIRTVRELTKTGWNTLKEAHVDLDQLWGWARHRAERTGPRIDFTTWWCTGAEHSETSPTFSRICSERCVVQEHMGDRRNRSTGRLVSLGVVGFACICDRYSLGV